MINGDIAAFGTAVTDTSVFLHEPDTLFKAEISAGHGTNGAKVNNVQGISVIKWSTGKDGNPSCVGSVDYTKFPCFGDLPAKAYTPAAQNTSFLVMNDTTAKIHIFRFNYLGDGHTALFTVVGHVVILQGTLSRLVADRAIDGVVNQLEFKHVMLDLFNMISV